MIGLKGVRVIVIDNAEEDALPILRAFARVGIPTAFFDGSLDQLPPENGRLSGVRLAILDMNLDPGVSDKAKASTLVTYLKNVLDPQNGPYAVLTWTNHPELEDLFESYLFSEQNVQNPIFMVSLTKAECKSSGKFDLALVSAKLDEKLKQVSPLLFLQAWEEKCFAAATGVANALSNLAAPDASDPGEWRDLWTTQLLELMHAMAQAKAGKSLDADSCLYALYGVLNPLHADRMESKTAELSKLLAPNSGEILEASPDCGSERKASVNTMLHLSFDGLEMFLAGNVYTFSMKTKPKWVPSIEQLLDDLFNPAGNQTAERKKEISSVSKLMLIEVSAPCDHAQKNLRVARFIAGLLVPSDVCQWLKKPRADSDFFRKFGPVLLNQPLAAPGQYYFYFSARHLVTSTLEQAAKMKADMRLRSQALADLQAWFASHAARPGKVLLQG